MTVGRDRDDGAIGRENEDDGVQMRARYSTIVWSSSRRTKKMKGDARSVLRHIQQSLAHTGSSDLSGSFWSLRATGSGYVRMDYYRPTPKQLESAGAFPP